MEEIWKCKKINGQDIILPTLGMVLTQVSCAPYSDLRDSQRSKITIKLRSDTDMIQLAAGWYAGDLLTYAAEYKDYAVTDIHFNFNVNHKKMTVIEIQDIPGNIINAPERMEDCIDYDPYEDREPLEDKVAKRERL